MFITFGKKNKITTEEQKKIYEPLRVNKEDFVPSDILALLLFQRHEYLPKYNLLHQLHRFKVEMSQVYNVKLTYFRIEKCQKGNLQQKKITVIINSWDGEETLEWQNSEINKNSSKCFNWQIYYKKAKRKKCTNKCKPLENAN